jgi:putative methyltransferase (TIGR04325 family)
MALSARGESAGFFWHSPLGLLAATVSAGQHAVRVLDFGGGVGQAFVQLLSTLRGATAVGYRVVDLDGVCAAGRQLFADDKRITFRTDWADIEEPVDVVYASSALPYVHDYEASLRRLMALKAPYVLLTKVAAGDFPPYAARQLNLAGQVLAYWFLNVAELIEIMSSGGYRCVYNEQVGRRYDQRNYPAAYRIGQMRNMLFVHKTRID